MRDRCPDCGESTAGCREKAKIKGACWRWNEEPTTTERRYEHLLFSELDAIQRDPLRSADDRLDAWEEEQARGEDA
jgi:hypothetical protein